MSQPALWAQIEELEAELGFDVEEMRRVATQIREGWIAPARVGCSPAPVAHFLAGCIRELVDADPQAPFPVIVPCRSRPSRPPA